MTKKTRAELIEEIDQLKQRIVALQTERDRLNTDLQISVGCNREVASLQTRVRNADLAIGMTLRILFDYNGDWDEDGCKIKHSEQVRALLQIRELLDVRDIPF